MKNLLHFFCILMLFAACGKKTEITPVIVNNPTLSLILSTDTVRPGESVVVTCSTENAVRTSNNFGAPTTAQWTHTLIPTKTTILEVSAFNNLEKSVSKTKTIIYIEWTKKDTMTNYLCSSPYLTTKTEHEYVPGIWEEQPMTPLEARQLRLFDKNGTYKLWDPTDGRIIVNNVPWYLTEDLKSLYYGGRTDSIGVLNNKTLILYYWVQSYNPQTSQWFDDFRGRRTYTHQ